MKDTTRTLTHAAPTTESARLAVLDAIRGFAFFGVVTANYSIDSFGWALLNDDTQVALAGPWGAAAYEFFRVAFVDGKFYTLFSLLFGVGFAMHIDAAERRGSLTIYKRRLAWLAVIGLLHMGLIYIGDILLPYALLGFALLLVRHVSDKTLLIAATVLLSLPPILQAITIWQDLDPTFGLYAFLDQFYAWFGTTPPASDEELIMRRAGEDWPFFLATQAQNIPFRAALLLESWRFFKLAGIMLLGLWIGRQILCGGFFTRRSFFQKAAFYSGLIGLPGAIAYGLTGELSAAPTLEGWLSHLAYYVGVVPLALFYGSVFILAWPRFQNVMGLFAAPGRMALTLYLAHTAIGLFLLEWTLKLPGRVNPIEMIAILALCLTGFTLFATLWLKRYRYGPMEWLWRTLSYGKTVEIRRVA